MRPGRRIRWALVAIMMFLPNSAWKRPPTAETKARVVIRLPTQQQLLVPGPDTGATPLAITAAPGVPPATFSR